MTPPAATTSSTVNGAPRPSSMASALATCASTYELDVLGIRSYAAIAPSTSPIATRQRASPKTAPVKPGSVADTMSYQCAAPAVSPADSAACAIATLGASSPGSVAYTLRNSARARSWSPWASAAAPLNHARAPLPRIRARDLVDHGVGVGEALGVDERAHLAELHLHRPFGSLGQEVQDLLGVAHAGGERGEEARRGIVGGDERRREGLASRRVRRPHRGARR